MSLLDIEVAHTHAIIEEALRSLGNTADEVAATLEAKGVQGKIGCPETCVLAAYLRDVPHGAYSVYVSSDDITVVATEAMSTASNWFDLVYDGDLIILLPDPVRDFVRNFDHHKYPTLVAGFMVGAEDIA